VCNVNCAAMHSAEGVCTFQSKLTDMSSEPPKRSMESQEVPACAL
jgi:hypothetical protein